MACEVNQIFYGEVAAVRDYGAFVKIPGCITQGLIHRSQVSSSYIDNVNDVLKRGEKVWCKVISIADDGKISLSMKLVNQGNGKDLDPNNVQLHLDQQKRKTMNYREERKAIVLDAVYKTTCSKCKTPGHLAKDCFSTRDGKKYELIPETEEEKVKEKNPDTESEVQTENKSKSKDKKHKIKKSKKRKKSKSSRYDDSDIEEGNSLAEKNKKKKKKSKDQKHKKRKNYKSSSDNESSDSSDSSEDNRKRPKKCKYSKSRHSD